MSTWYVRPVSPWAATDSLSWVIQSCSPAPAFSSCSIQCCLPAPPARGCLWMSSDSAERPCTSVPNGTSGIVISSMQTLHQLNSLLLYLRCRLHLRATTLLGSCVTWKLVSHIQIRMWVHGGLSWVSESSPEWQMNHFTWHGSRWSVLAGSGICAACFLNQMIYFSQN